MTTKDVQDIIDRPERGSAVYSAAQHDVIRQMNHYRPGTTLRVVSVEQLEAMRDIIWRMEDLEK